LESSAVKTERDVTEKFLDVVIETLDWWEFDGSPIEGDKVMARLKESMQDFQRGHADG